MFELFFGLFMTAFSCFSLIAFLKVSSLIALVICGIFISIGVILFVVGLRKVIIDHITSRKGEECFGRVESISDTGKLVNEKTIYKASFVVYVGSLNDIRRVSEEIGMDPSKYPIGSYVRLKYYEGDINVIGIAYDESVIADDIKKIIEENFRPIQGEVIVDGEKYIGMN